ncbi:protein-L-isoaspartate(D-aspartate) O-methyltransferase [Bradyrhizobium sp. LHD-71]|uniref:protein-L-isoaspartate(D-aspartate) O-methyltransferase n=1 Tax=Bradyrhizobium sp. LHD-71 TaxID=3072141 RepID=UPI00280F5824|nr:protein-L-isoaspartate(D-aspartate) O-methyltransferase [Bradyrhizobium sp. LHD-71]MDQ8728822.1 protein-L-isoaspartate(D-aspartate) O-methyltransferase [Bradyrhizobium sp. LHD-71]
MNFQLLLRRRGIVDHAVLKAMDEVPREDFVEPITRDDAYADVALPIACGQTISQPFVVAYMTEQLQLRRYHRVLEIGTGSGYQAAVLSHLAAEVVTVERYRTLADRARLRLRRLARDNVEVLTADGFDLPDELGLFDRVMVTAAMEEVPESLKERLTKDGVLLAPVGPDGGVQVLMRIRRRAPDSAADSASQGFATEELLEVRFVPALKGIARQL